MREVQWRLAKFVADPARNEPRNVGVFVLSSVGPMKYKLLGQDGGPLPPWLDADAYSKTVDRWKRAIAEHGDKAIHWIGKRQKGDPYYIELAGVQMTLSEVNIDTFFEELVAPPADVCLVCARMREVARDVEEGRLSHTDAVNILWERFT
jgi:hypothetical protein